MDRERLVPQVDTVPSLAYRSATIMNGVDALPLNETIPTVTSPNHAFVVLGYALDSDGYMQDTLLGRLIVAKHAAEKNDNSKLIVSGGLSRGGKTEADVMAEWLQAHGVHPSRIIKEDQSDDTVENALYSLNVMEQEGVLSATLITSASHVRRALLLFQEVDESRRVSSHVVYRDYWEADNGFDETEQELAELGIQRIVAWRKLARSRSLGAGALKPAW